jgi:hypothetical protein
MKVLSVLAVCGLMSGILLSVEFGYQTGLWRWRRVPEKARGLPSTIAASIFGLMGLLIAFIFYGAGSRFETRRNLMAQEANAIGTAYLRLDLLPPATQPGLREDFRKYVRARFDMYQSIPDMKAVNAALAQSSALQRSVWKAAEEAAKESGPAEKSLVLTSLNEMIDITTVQAVASTMHPPNAVFAMLALSVIVSSALAGYTMSATGIRDWIFVFAYVFVLGAAVFVILDYEYPRIGIIRIEPLDQLLIETLEKMK